MSVSLLSDPYRRSHYDSVIQSVCLITTRTDKLTKINSTKNIHDQTNIHLLLTAKTENNSYLLGQILSTNYRIRE